MQGLATLWILGSLSARKSYWSYVRSHQDEPKGASLTDVFFFDGELLVAVCLGLRFQRLPRLLFHRLLQKARSVSAVGRLLVQSERRLFM